MSSDVVDTYEGIWWSRDPILYETTVKTSISRAEVVDRLLSRFNGLAEFIRDDMKSNYAQSLETDRYPNSFIGIRHYESMPVENGEYAHIRQVDVQWLFDAVKDVNQ